MATGCLSRNYDYNFELLIGNATSDTLTLLIGMKKLNTIQEPYANMLLLPHDTIDPYKSTLGFFGTDAGEDDIKFLFLTGWKNFDTVLIFRRDTLKSLWSFPSFSGPCTEHSFFNYNSWKTWLTYPDHGKMMFTVYPSDLTLNGR
jgi:hypothetical protein